MKKAVIRTIIIVAAVIIALGTTILVLSLIQNNPFADSLAGYSRVEIYDLGSSQVEPELSDADQATFDNALKTTSYSIMQGILEGKAGAGLELKKNANDELVETEGSEIKSISSSSVAYKLEFVYASNKTITVEDKTIEYDRAVVLIHDTVNEIEELEIIFYDYDKVDNEVEDDEEYKVNTVLVRAKTTDFYNALSNLTA